MCNVYMVLDLVQKLSPKVLSKKKNCTTLVKTTLRGLGSIGQIIAQGGK
jgi:hypothetical protein